MHPPAGTLSKKLAILRCYQTETMNWCEVPNLMDSTLNPAMPLGEIPLHAVVYQPLAYRVQVQPLFK